MANLISIEGKTNGNAHTYTIKKHPDNTKKSSIGSFGFSIMMYNDITGNCQLGSVQVACKLANLNIPEFKEFWNTIFYKKPVGWRAPWYKSTLMIDVHNRYVNKLVYRFEKAGAYIRLKKGYTNRTGSKMTMMIVDLRGKRDNE